MTNTEFDGNPLAVEIASLSADSPTLAMQNGAFSRICTYLDKGGRASDVDIASIVKLVVGSNPIAKNYALDIVIKLLDSEHAITEEQRAALLKEARKYDHTYHLKLRMGLLMQLVHSTMDVVRLLEVVCGHLPDTHIDEHKHIVQGAKRGLERHLKSGRELKPADVDAIISAIVYSGATVAFSAALTLSSLIDHGLRLSRSQIYSLRKPHKIPMVGHVCSEIAEKADRINLADGAERPVVSVPRPVAVFAAGSQGPPKRART